VRHFLGNASLRGRILAAVAVAHIAALRQAEIPYSFRPVRDANYPFGVFVVRKQIRQAKETIRRMGLGADAIE
jgi:hypothetical protein